MLTEICQYLHNWFDRNQDKWYGKFSINDDGELTYQGRDDFYLVPGQYFRIVGSVLNDGVYIYPASGLVPEVFVGSVWGMAVPPAVVSLSHEIEAWNDKYGGIDSVNMSPYNSESFGGYSYSKSCGGSSADGTTGTWQSAFATRLNMWRKLP